MKGGKKTAAGKGSMTTLFLMGANVGMFEEGVIKGGPDRRGRRPSFG